MQGRCESEEAEIREIKPPTGQDVQSSYDVEKGNADYRGARLCVAAATGCILH